MFHLEHRLYLWRAVLTDLTTESGSVWIETMIDCMLSMMEWLVTSVATRILIHTYKFRTINKSVLPLHIFISRNPCKPFAEPSLRNIGVDVWIWMKGMLNLVILKTWCLCMFYYFIFTGNLVENNTKTYSLFVITFFVDEFAFYFIQRWTCVNWVDYDKDH